LIPFEGIPWLRGASRPLIDDPASLSGAGLSADP